MEMALTAQRISMVGIGGIGMSALAQFLVHEGKTVHGSDRDDSPVVELLRHKGIQVEIGAGTIPVGTELLIYSDAVPSSNPARVRAKEMEIPELSYFEALGEVSKGARTIAVAGTHGKTTTTGMLAKVLVDAGEKPTAIVGSIVRDFNSNFVAGRGDLFVIEACEYRDHLLKLSPEILVITNLELDHTDYFPNLEALQETFRKAAHSVPSHGVIITNPDDPTIAPILEGVSARVVDYTQKAVGALQLIGDFNRMNARAALAAAQAAVPFLSQEAAVKSLSSFKGSWRRFEYKGEMPSGALVYDDYAHHPTEIQKTILAAREKFPDKKIVIVFHPHLFSRTRDLFEGFVGALSKADRVLLAPIYAAREEDTGEVSSEILAEAVARLNPRAHAYPSFDALRDALLRTATKDELVITMGAGDIYKLAEQIAD